VTTVKTHCFSSHSPSFSEVASEFSSFLKCLSFVLPFAEFLQHQTPPLRHFRFLLMTVSGFPCCLANSACLPLPGWMHMRVCVWILHSFHQLASFHVVCLTMQTFWRRLCSFHRLAAKKEGAFFKGCSGDCLLEQRKPAPFHLPKKKPQPKGTRFFTFQKRFTYPFIPDLSFDHYCD